MLNSLKAIGRAAVRRSSVRCLSEGGKLSDSPEGLKKALTGERSVNDITLVGRVGRDPELRGTVEHPVTIFSVATSVSFKTPEDTYIQKTEWHRVSVFRPVLRDLVAKLVVKGDRVYVRGSINYSEYMNVRKETVRSATVIADDVIQLTSKGDRRFSEETVDFE